MHPLVAHALDVAAAAILLPQRRGLGLQGRTIGFLVALHDIGKFSRPFQWQADAHWPTAALGSRPVTMRSGPKHDSLGYALLNGALSVLLDPLFPPREHGRRGWTNADRKVLFRSLAGHHGRPPKEDDTVDVGVFCAACDHAAKDFIRAAFDVFRPEPLALPQTERQVHALGWQLAGLTTLADWIGSRQTWFPYERLERVQDPAEYFWDRALPRAAAAIAAAGLSEAQPARFTGMRRLFDLPQATPVQRWADTVPLPTDGPILAVIEDLTGSGKTEAAMVLAHRLIAAGRAGGLFFALPTMATANAMFGRLSDAYRRLFAADAHPSLALAHGRALLDPRFIAAIPAEADPFDTPRDEDPADEPAEAHCAAWLAQDGRRALLAQVGVGTIDQALLAVLPVRHAALRLQGLAGKILIIDEAHAFDAYMQREMLALLEFHAALGGSAVLLSATLPKALRERLVAAFRKGLLGREPKQALTEMAYPLATLATAADVTETPCDPRAGLPRRVAVTRLPDAAAAMQHILAAAQAGAAVAWVRNTVDAAIAGAEALRAQGCEPLLFHARFAMADRVEIERAVLRRFGRDGTGRAGVVVATQVIEQSLDLDFDLLVTDLAPADLLIQRAGRLWRHERGTRPVAGPELLIVSPEPTPDPPADWIRGPQPGTAAVYRDPALLWRSARAVFARGAIVTPDDMRPLIEEAFAGEVPPALAREAEAAEGKARAAVEVARMNVLQFARPYDRSAGFWEPETRTPTRLEERERVTLRLAVVREDRVVPYAEDPDIRRAWALSEVSVARSRIAACPVPVGLEAAAAAAKADWGRWERESDRMVLAVMTPTGSGGFSLEGTREIGQPITATYRSDTGLLTSG